ncbi:MAG TPA: glycosyltransferase [Blastocatellia bacterium]|nr:glycosyltransferase [Blastocatellia bacterium]
MKFSVIIATYNRAQDLRETLQSLAGLSPLGNWEVIVVDNNSSDDTADVIREAAKTFPVSLQYLFEREQGRCAALNAGIRAAKGGIIVTTDDDVRVQPDWLDRAAESLTKLNCDYVGGKVLPIWRGGRPDWLPNRGGRHWAVIALLDYGPEPLQFGKRVPLGVNMAFRREAFARAGLWNNNVGRKAGTLLGQEVREWGLRAAAAGLRGFYAPEMVVGHVIPAERLNKQYFRRWFYWHGISRALLYKETGADMEAPEESSLDFANVPHVFGVPRYLFRTAAANCLNMAKGIARQDSVFAFESELLVWFFAGIFRQRWKDRNSIPQKKSLTFNQMPAGPETSPGKVARGV